MEGNKKNIGIHSFSYFAIKKNLENVKNYPQTVSVNRLPNCTAHPLHHKSVGKKYEWTKANLLFRVGCGDIVTGLTIILLQNVTNLSS